MIVYNQNFDLNLIDFGIEVPILDDRSKKCFFELKKRFPYIEETSLEKFPEISEADLLRVHTRKFVEGIFGNNAKEAVIDCYELINKRGQYNRYDPESAKYALDKLRDKVILQTQASYFSLLEAYRTGFTFGLCGGMHHAMTDRSRGFCLINDIVICARKFQDEVSALKFSIIDIDAHKGCGTAEITENDSSIETLSIHMKSGWPLSKECGDGPWRIPSNIDIEIEQGDESSYLSKLREGLDRLENLDIAIVVAGADPYEKDVLESANGIRLTKAQMLERDLLVYNFLKERGTPQVWLIAGGYGPDAWEVYYQFLKSIHEEEHA